MFPFRERLHLCENFHLDRTFSRLRQQFLLRYFAIPCETDLYENDHWTIIIEWFSPRCWRPFACARAIYLITTIVSAIQLPMETTSIEINDINRHQKKFDFVQRCLTQWKTKGRERNIALGRAIMVLYRRIYGGCIE